MTEAEMEQRRAEKRAELPMHQSLKALFQEGVRKAQEFEAEARATVLCECPGHTRVLWDAMSEAKSYDYRWQIDRALNKPVLDLPGLLRRAGCPEFAVARVHQGNLDDRPSLYAAKVYQGLKPNLLSPRERKVQLLVEGQVQARQRRPFLGLFGIRGTGKSLAAVWAMAQSMRRHAWNAGATGSRQSFPFAFVRMVEFAGVLAFDQSTREWMERLKHARMVILDDMGKELLSPAAQMMLFELLDVRYSQGLSTVITSELKVAEFQLRYDGAVGANGKPGAIFRRLSERGVILRDGGDAGALLMCGEDRAKTWPKADGAKVVPLKKSEVPPAGSDGGGEP